MPRRLVTIQFPQPPVRTDDFLVVVPNADAALNFSGKVTTLRRIALEELRSAGLNEATPLQTHFALIRAVVAVNGSKNASSLAARYRPDLAAALRSGVDLDALKTSGSSRVSQFARVAQMYSDLLLKQKAVDPDAVLNHARKAKIPERRKILAYGFFRARPVLARREEYDLIDAIAADESVMFLPDGDGYIFEENRKWIGEFQSRGWIIDNGAISLPASKTVGGDLAARFARADGRKSVDKQPEAYRFASAEDEVRSVLAMAKREILSGTPPERICIVCRKPELYAEAIRTAADEIGVPVEFDLRIPLSATKVGSFVSLLLEANADGGETAGTRHFDFETTARLIFHPAVNRPPFDIWINARKTYPSGSEEWKNLYPDFETLVLDTQDQTRQEFAGQVLRAIENLDIRGRVAGDSEELLAIEQIVRLLTAYGRQGDKKTISYLRFLTEITSFLAEITTDFCAALGGIRVKMPNAVIGSFFDTIFAIGLAEGIHPIQPSETLTVDYFERKQLAAQRIYFEDAAEIPRWEDITFCYTLFSACKKVVLSFPSAIGNDEQIASPYFSRLGATPKLQEETVIAGEGDRLRYFLSGDRPIDEMPPLFEGARHSLKVERTRNSSADYDEYDGVIGVSLEAGSFGWSASRLTDFGRCPFKWFAKYCLGLKPVDEASIELDALTRGTFYHKVLEIAGRRSKDSADFRKAMLENIDDAFAEAEQQENPGITNLPDWELRRSEILAMLRDAILSTDFIEPDATVIDFEKEFKIEVGGFRLAGRIDRIDRTVEGIAAVDYKTSSSISKICNDSGKLESDVQMPVYNAALENLYPGEKISEGRYFNLRKGKSFSAKELVDLGSYIQYIRREFSFGRFPVRPCAKQEVCKYCEFDAVCRRGVRLHLKRSDVSTK